MAAPVIAMVGIAAASSIVQFLNSERGRAMAREERKRLEALIDKLESPQFDTSIITPPELKLLETYTPEVAQLVYEADPELITADSDRAIAGKAAQQATLSRLEAIAAGQDPLGDATIIKAINDAIEASGTQRNAILADMARQGMSPGSSAYGLMQSQAAGQSQKNMFDASLNAAIAERQRRQNAMGESAALGGKMLQSEIDLERMNDSIINAINQRNTQARRQYLANRANTLNDAQMRNQKERQRIYETNASNVFESQLRGQDLRNKQIQADYNTQRDKLNAYAGNARFPEITEETQGRNQAIQGLSNAALIASLLAKDSGPVPQDASSVDSQGYPNYIRPSNEIPI